MISALQAGYLFLKKDTKTIARYASMRAHPRVFTYEAELAIVLESAEAKNTEQEQLRRFIGQRVTAPWQEDKNVHEQYRDIEKIIVEGLLNVAERRELAEKVFVPVAKAETGVIV